MLEKINKKYLTIFVIIIIVVSSAGFYIWYTDYNRWTIEELDSKVIEDKNSFKGFKSDLEGETKTVEGKVTSLSIKSTNQGERTFIELDDYSKLKLVKEGSFEHEVGDHVSIDVEFKKADFNGKEYVFSPQVPIECFALPLQKVIKETNNMSGFTMEQSSTSDGKIRVTVEKCDENDVFPLNLSETSCELYSGCQEIGDDYSSMGKGEDKRELMVDYGTLSDEKEKDGIKFVDKNDNKILDEGDYFEISNIKSPDEELSVDTYHFEIDVEDSSTNPPPWISYIIMNEDGLLTLTSS